MLGDVLETQTCPIGDSKAMLPCVDGVYGVGIQMVLDKIKLLSRGKELIAGPLHKAENIRYLAKEELLRHSRYSGIRLVDGDRVVQVLVESFAPPQKREELRKKLDEVVMEWYAQERVGGQQ